MGDLEKKVGGETKSTSTPYISSEKVAGVGGFALSVIITGAYISSYIDGLTSKIFGGLFVAGGVGSLWMNGYSPIELGKELLEGIGKLACYPYDHMKNYYKKRKS